MNCRMSDAMTASELFGAEEGEHEVGEEEHGRREPQPEIERHHSRPSARTANAARRKKPAARTA